MYKGDPSKTVTTEEQRVYQKSWSVFCPAEKQVTELRTGDVSLVVYTWPEFDPQHHIKLGMVVQACNPNTAEVEVIGSEVQGHPR